ncbi:MAG TPA: peptidoglycan DD-metalloendopeptidase family protein [Gammaproteobacteria bacterium]
MLAIASAIAGVIALINPSQKAEATRHPDSAEASVNLPLSSGNSSEAYGDAPAASPDVHLATVPAWQEVKVANGDTLSQIFSRLELDSQQMYAVLESDRQTKQALTRLLPGESLLFDIQGGELHKLQYSLSPTQILHVEKVTRGGYQSTVEELPVETRISHASSTINSSLFGAGLEAGLSDNLLMQLVGIFGWDIDFALDIRNGDTFTVVYEERYVNGSKLGDGEVLAAEFINQGHSYRAVRFREDDGTTHYYTPEGNSMRKAFLRTPVEFSRISSRFGGRLHPVLQTFRMHKGVDYAAPIGTPVKSTGDGKIAFRGVQHGYGNVIILQHGGKYSTVYGHLSSFKSGLGVGSRVKQGQVIAYVGKSGLATGPHLHYEFRVNGVHTNPLTVKLPNAGPVPNELKAQFLEQTAPLIAQLDVLKQTQVALVKE